MPKQKNLKRENSEHIIKKPGRKRNEDKVTIAFKDVVQNDFNFKKSNNESLELLVNSRQRRFKLSSTSNRNQSFAQNDHLQLSVQSLSAQDQQNHQEWETFRQFEEAKYSYKLLNFNPDQTLPKSQIQFFIEEIFRQSDLELINLNNLKYESVNLKLKSYPDLFCNSDWLPCVDNKFMYNQQVQNMLRWVCESLMLDSFELVFLLFIVDQKCFEIINLRRKYNLESVLKMDFLILYLGLYLKDKLNNQLKSSNNFNQNQQSLQDLFIYQMHKSSADQVFTRFWGFDENQQNFNNNIIKLGEVHQLFRTLNCSYQEYQQYFFKQQITQQEDFYFKNQQKLHFQADKNLLQAQNLSQEQENKKKLEISIPKNIIMTRSRSKQPNQQDQNENNIEQIKQIPRQATKVKNNFRETFANFAQNNFPSKSIPIPKNESGTFNSNEQKDLMPIISQKGDSLKLVKPQVTFNPDNVQRQQTFGSGKLNEILEQNNFGFMKNSLSSKNLSEYDLFKNNSLAVVNNENYEEQSTPYLSKGFSLDPQKISNDKNLLERQIGGQNQLRKLKDIVDSQDNEEDEIQEPSKLQKFFKNCSQFSNADSIKLMQGFQIPKEQATHERNKENQNKDQSQIQDKTKSILPCMPSIRPLDSYDYKNDGVDLNFLNANSIDLENGISNNGKNYLNFSNLQTVSNCLPLTSTISNTNQKKRTTNRLYETIKNSQLKDTQGTLIDLRNEDKETQKTKFEKIKQKNKII